MINQATVQRYAPPPRTFPELYNDGNTTSYDIYLLELMVNRAWQCVVDQQQHRGSWWWYNDGFHLQCVTCVVQRDNYRCQEVDCQHFSASKHLGEETPLVLHMACDITLQLISKHYQDWKSKIFHQSYTRPWCSSSTTQPITHLWTCDTVPHQWVPDDVSYSQPER